MILTREMYAPAIRWRQGEYQALSRLFGSAKDRIVPIITIPEIEFDFEEWRPKKTAHEHVHPFIARYKAKWNNRPAWIGVHESIAKERMDDGRDIFTYVFEGIRSFEANAIPLIPIDAPADILKSIASIMATDNHGVAISVRLEDAMKPDLSARLQKTALALGAEIPDVDLIFDLGGSNFEPYDVFVIALQSVLLKLKNLNAFRNFVVVGTAIPESFKDVAKGSDEIIRHDWNFYKSLVTKLPQGVRRPNYGDYTIVHPKFTPIDMRKIKSSGKIIYTTSGSWFVRKGGAFRDNPTQMHGHCKAIVDSGIFKGADFSNGDDYISKCAAMQEGPSNQTRWKDVAINHHITHVLFDLATLHAAS